MLTLEPVIQKIQQLPPNNKKSGRICGISRISSEPQTPTASETAETSFADATKEFIGCLDSDLEDLSHNPQYLAGFGK